MSELIKEKLNSVLENMKKCGTDYLYIPLSDDHQSEYVQDAYQTIRYLTGFTGSNATVIFGAKENEGVYLWTDGRYFIQAEKELTGSGVILMRMGEKGVPSVPEFLKTHMGKGDKLALSAPLCDAQTGCSMKTITEEAGGEFYALDSLQDYFTVKTKPVSHKAYAYPLKYAGKSFAEKLSEVRAALEAEGASALAVKNLEEICWLFNIRGTDIPCNPVVLSFALITKDNATLYLYESAVDEQLLLYAKENSFEIKPYDTFYQDLSDADETFLYDAFDSNLRMGMLIKEKTHKCGTNPIPLMKAVKNETEIKWIHKYYTDDSAELTKYLISLKIDPDIHAKNEYEIAMKLDERRASLEGFLDISFETISAFGGNAAMMHYEPTSEKSDLIGTDNFLLIDSGGQYYGATTDVTRTIPFGTITEEMKEAYTDTVVGNLRLMDAVFIKGTCGLNLDILARERFWKKGQDYKCGTGHGIGSCLSVHEAPPNISWQYRRGRDIPLAPGMIVSDEPGVYREGSFGIRVENILLVVPFTETEEGTFYRFVNLTKVPLENSCMLKEKMNPDDIARYNAFQKDVYDSLLPYLDEKEREIVQKMTSPL